MVEGAQAALSFFARVQGLGDWLATLRTIASLCLGLALWPTAWAEAAGDRSPSLRPVKTVGFCQTGPTYATDGCRWQAVTLPHRWVPVGPDDGWAVYRIPLEAWPAGARLALLAQRLSLSGVLHTGGQAQIAAVPPQGVHARYWPQVFTFTVPAEGPSSAQEVFLRVRGHVAAKNGLGRLDWGEEGVIREERSRLELSQVTLTLALAAATVVVGIIGFIPSNFQTPAGRMMFCIAGLALTAGMRIAMNYVTTPPVGWHAWLALNLSLLVAIGAWQASTLAIYLFEGAGRIAVPAFALWLGLSLGFLAFPSTWLYPLAEAAFAALTLATTALVVVLARRMWVAHDAVGLTLLGVCASVVGVTVHDLSLHLGIQSVSGQYKTIWTMPGLLILMSTLMMRHLQSQRALELALLQETLRREDLIRDLHDGLGSRLVALAFHARQIHGAPRLSEEVSSIIHELQIIQSTVRAGSSLLVPLLADMRHLYGQLGGGHIPLRWDIDEGLSEIRLTADQTLATVRIIDEAIANAIKHAKPSFIAVRLAPGSGLHRAELVIDNDGGGQFLLKSSGGLRNMQARAQRAGLMVEISEEVDVRRVRILYPEKPRAPQWLSMFGFASRTGKYFSRQP